MLCLAIIAALATQAAGQCRTCPRSQPQTERLEVSGYIENMQGNQILVKTVTDQLWLLQVTRETQIQVTGSASSPEILKPGMSIAFTSQFDKSGNGQQPVEQLTIFTPTREKGYGAIPAAVNGIDGMAGLAPPAGQQPQSDVATYTVAGKITSYKDGKAKVFFGRGTATVEIAGDCRVAITVSDPSIVKKGDSIEAKGQMPAGQTQNILQTGRGMGRADQIEIQMAKPLEPPKRRSTIHRSTPR